MHRFVAPRIWRKRLAIFLGLSLTIHAVLLALLGMGLGPLTSLPVPRAVPPMQIVMLPPQPKPAPLPPPPPHRRRRHRANPLPPAPKPRVARQPKPEPKPVQPAPKPEPKPAPKPSPPPAPVKQVAERPAPPKTPTPAPPAPAPAIPAPTPPEPVQTLTVPAPEAPPAPQPASDPGGSPADGSGSGSQGTGNGSPGGNGSGTGSGSGSSSGSGEGAAPYWPFGIDAGNAGGGGPRHIVYILDVSASMTSRIAQAREEIKHAIDTLQPGESFDVLTFCQDTRLYSDGLVPATEANENSAERFLNVSELGPGTNLEAALRQALRMADVNVIVLVTDGVPTVGEQNWKKLERMARRENVSNAKIYTVGLVGKNPDGSDDSFEAAKLLEKISEDSDGQSKIYTLGVATPQ